MFTGYNTVFDLYMLAYKSTKHTVWYYYYTIDERGDCIHTDRRNYKKRAIL